MPPVTQNQSDLKSNTPSTTKDPRPIAIQPAIPSIKPLATGEEPCVSSKSTSTISASTTSQKPATTFHFVNLTDPEIDSSTRKSINVHVQKIDREKKRWERIKRPLENRELFPARLQPASCRCGIVPDTSARGEALVRRGGQNLKICLKCGGLLGEPDGGGGGGRPSLRDEGGAVKIQAALPSPKALLSQGRTNPFTTYPIEASPETEMLVDFFAQFIVPQHLAFGEKKNSPYLTSVVPTSLSDPAPFHGMLLSAAFYMYQATGESKWAQVGIMHLGSAIRAINRSLNDRKKAVTNENITGVMYMIAFELANGDISACRFHMGGLSHMVQLRGGIQNPHFGFLRNQIMWADRNAASLLGTKPYFSPVDSMRIPPSKLDILPESLNPGFRELLRKGNARPELVKALAQTCQKFTVLSKTDDPVVWMKNVGPFSQENIIFEYLLLDSPNEPVTSMSIFDAMTECTRVATLLFYSATNEERPRESALVQSLGAQLKARMEQLRVDECLDTYPEELLWLSFAAYRVRGDLRNWFAKQLSPIYRRLGVQTWEGCLAILKKFLWLHRIALPSEDLYRLSRILEANSDYQGRKPKSYSLF